MRRTGSTLPHSTEIPEQIRIVLPLIYFVQTRTVYPHLVLWDGLNMFSRFPQGLKPG